MRTRWAIAWLWLQSAAIAGWCLVRWLSEAARSPFVVDGWPVATLCSARP
jgi:hypothetical protein